LPDDGIKTGGVITGCPLAVSIKAKNISSNNAASFFIMAP
jgi:hypothetical protein